MERRIDIDIPRWDQRTFVGRLRHFLCITDYRTVILPRRRLEEAKILLEQYRKGDEPPGTTEKDLYYAKKLYESAYHPDSGDLQNVIGRMSFQVPGGMILTAGMLQFYKSNSAVILWQWLNQSFNALVNYTNRNAGSSMSTKQMGIAYVSATTSAVITAIGLKAVLAKRASSLLQRFVPFAAVAAANMVNIPLTRQSELREGITMVDENGNQVTKSKYAACKGISQVVFSRITIAAPGMCILPVIMEQMEKKSWFMRYPRGHIWFQTFILGCLLTFMVPVGCSLFPQKCSISTSRMSILDKDEYRIMKATYGDKIPETLYFNKGL